MLMGDFIFADCDFSMRIGILSDTHDRLDAMIAGMKVLKHAGAEMFIHCGDVGGEKILDCLAGENVIVVWGNCDFDRAGMARYGADVGINCQGEFAELEIAGKRIVVTHGDDGKLMRRLLAGNQHDYLLHGHTHMASDDRLGRLRIINPGALYRASVKSVAILDPVEDVLQSYRVDI